MRRAVPLFCAAAQKSAQASAEPLACAPAPAHAARPSCQSPAHTQRARAACVCAALRAYRCRCVCLEVCELARAPALMLPARRPRAVCGRPPAQSTQSAARVCARAAAGQVALSPGIASRAAAGQDGDQSAPIGSSGKLQLYLRFHCARSLAVGYWALTLAASS